MRLIEKLSKDIFNGTESVADTLIAGCAYICDRVIIFKEGSIEEIVKIEHLKNVKSFYARKLLQSLITF
ncbi:hypothetical protein FS935_00835 [Metabacillus litoralis]|uniref:Uncharacterized protein n=1 Tax=Metabacillus litoralis TaxID=152268 RepID=A0A5C6WA70_9BACI|nr:hypothetical protein [Metabacillus litoralis]TXC92779.1 hypothetical protein FS935_00835 [Metabacillus litoralis]